MASNTFQLIGQGIGLGALHVLTGPDHLSALATLSANVGNCRAFTLGMRWGLGHSFGLLLVGIPLIFISTAGDDDKIVVNETLEKVSESFVGVFMLLLGFYGLYRANRKRLINEMKIIEEQSQSLSLVTTTDSSKKPSTTIEKDVELSSSSSSSSSKNIISLRKSIGEDDEDSSNTTKNTIQEETPASINSSSCDDDDDDKIIIDDATKKNDNRGGWSYKTLAIAIGIAHGVAGPGGVLGIIPAVQLRDVKLAFVYLGSFCISSTITMGSYSAIYGTVTAKLGYGHEYQIEIFSSLLSIVVGVMWLILLSIDKLHSVFP